MTRTIQDINDTRFRLQELAGNNLARQSRIRNIANAYIRNITNSRQYKDAAEYGGEYARRMAYDSDTYRGVTGRKRIVGNGNSRTLGNSNS